MDLPVTGLRADPAPADWVAVDSCTLPTAEQPLRVAEFDALFTTTLYTAEQTPASPTRARLVLAGDEGLAAGVQQLADAETSCCSFFSFTVTQLELDAAAVAAHSMVALDVEVPPGRADVLAALIGRARHAREAVA